MKFISILQLIINIIFNITEGKKDLIERINITGNNTTNEEVIRGELIVDEGDPLTKLNIEKSIAELKERGIFKTVSYEIKDGSSNNLKVVNIRDTSAYTAMPLNLNPLERAFL